MKKIDLRRSSIIFLFDLVFCLTTYFSAVYLKFGSLTDLNHIKILSLSIPEHILFAVISFFNILIFRTYKSIWKYISINDLINIIKFSSTIIIIFLISIFIINRGKYLPRSFFIINWLLLIALMGAPRLLYRVIREKFTHRANSSKQIPILLYGINNNTEFFIREVNRLKNSIYKVVGILDNDNSKIGSYLHNIKIYGDYKSLISIYKSLKDKNQTPQKIILTDDYIKGTIVRNLFQTSGELGINIAKMPRITDFQTNIDNEIKIKPIVIEDLLGRAQSNLNKTGLFDLVNTKKILITGCGGTIGSELTRQIASYNPKKIILIEHAEFNLYFIDKEIKTLYPQVGIKSILADIRNENYMDKIFANELPEVIFHAAALKHVPLVEDNIIEAVSTNIIGTKIVANMAVKHKVEQMILISTDKAVNPSSVMGFTKRIAEKYISSIESHSDTKFSTVRFGNVLGSSGSVIPLFKEQIKAGGPITVTHPDMVRYFMTVREAVELVLQAAIIAKKSNEKNYIFVLDMGEPVKISDLALQMIKMSGLRPNIDIEVKYTGIRAGEKLYEELYYDYEEKIQTECNSIILIKNIHTDFLYMKNIISQIEQAIYNCDSDVIKNLITNILTK